MKYTVEQYAQAILEAIKENKSQTRRKEVVQNFLRLLSRRGDSKFLPLILNKLETKYWKGQGIKKIKLEYADSPPTGIKKEIEKILGKDTLLTEKKNPAILGGIKILVDGELLIDASVKYRLDKMTSIK